ncbi:MetQ/NlpA family ABC transporter substrate-binding protein [Bacillota bacterium Meth-B3]|nr:MetQ/NlpA family ABC transporter substrate-binding protein [Christensenellaceae bacterium]MEA5065222.1 MetQ/NlpA family ABC transporter substrate-binding protein [Eubacteriales bacterium]MEA5069203.1 MetQ/NlpA family ABC transporter substrate-binding protein [Christensenellaceae bacterium]
MKKLLSVLLALGLILSVSPAFAAEKIVIGATPSPHQEILELIKPDFDALGYDLEIITFTEYPLPNPALATGELNANYFQHIPYLSAYNATVPESEQLVAAIGVHYEPYGIYAGRVNSIEALSDGGVIAVTNDPSNETRALLLLESAGLIVLPKGTTPDSSVTALDIVENPKNLDIREMDANLIPSTLNDVDLAVINGNFALDAGLSPATDAIYLEAADSEAGKVYTNYVVIRQADQDAQWVKDLESVLCSKKVADFVLTSDTYKGGVIPAFEVK